MNRSPRACVLYLALAVMLVLGVRLQAAQPRPNILFCISDDQSYQHTGANGEPQIKTPAFDRIAREGIRFTRAFCDAPTCGPSRSAILTGQSIWRLEEAGNIHSTLPAKFTTYTQLLQEAQRLIADDAVNAFLFVLPKIGVWDARLTGFWANSPLQANDVTAVRCSGGILITSNGRICMRLGIS